MYSINEKREFIDDFSYQNQIAHMYNKILVPLDGTQNDQAVLEHVRLMAKNLGSALFLIQLYRVMKDNDPFFQVTICDFDERDSKESNVKENIKHLEKHIKKYCKNEGFYYIKEGKKKFNIITKSMKRDMELNNLLK